jgi:hypothetical protein
MIIRTTIKSVYYPAVRPRTSALIYRDRRIPLGIYSGQCEGSRLKELGALSKTAGRFNKSGGFITAILGHTA